MYISIDVGVVAFLDFFLSASCFALLMAFLAMGMSMTHPVMGIWCLLCTLPGPCHFWLWTVVTATVAISHVSSRFMWRVYTLS